MAQVVCRTEKLTTFGNVGGCGAHMMRTRPTLNAVLERIGLNRPLVGTLDADVPALVKERIKDHGVKTRVNSVLAFEMLLSASPEHFRPDFPEQAGTWDAQRLEEWVESSTKWLKKKYGDRVISAVLHLDESTPHIHAVIVPVDEKNSLNCRSFLGGRQLLRELQTDAWKAVEHLGLERGREWSGAKHTKIQEYYLHVNGAFEEVPQVLTPMPIKPKPAPEAPGFFAGPAAKKDHAHAEKIYTAEKLRYEALLKKHRDEVDAANKKAHELAKKNQAQAADSKLKEKQLRQLTAENSKLGARLEKSRKELNALTAKLRGVELVDVLQRVYKATEEEASKPAHKTRKFHLRHRSGTVVVTGEQWADNATGENGKGGINLVLQLEGWGQDRFRDAARVLADHFNPKEVAAALGQRIAAVAVAQVEAAMAEPRPGVDLTHVPATWSQVSHYLAEVRRIPAVIVDRLQATGLLRSDARANAVFLREGGRGCIRRGSNDPGDRPVFKQTQGLVRQPFVVAGQPEADVWICEDPIDALSILSMWPRATVIATGGNSDVRILVERAQQLAANGERVVLGYSWDASGDARAALLAAKLIPALPGHTIVRARQIEGVNDWNAALQRWPSLSGAGLVLLDDGRVLHPADLAVEPAQALQAEAQDETDDRVEPLENSEKPQR